MEHETATIWAELCGGVPCALYVGNDAEALMRLLTDAADGRSARLDVQTTLGFDAKGRVQVASLRAWLAGRTDGLHVVCNGAASPYLCRPLLMGADIVIEDLRAWVSASLLEAARVPQGPVCAVIARTQGSGEAMGSVCQNASLAPWTGAGSPALTAALETLSLTEQRRYDTALALAHYLAAHPHVAWVSYPGLADDPCHAAAEHVLEHGFGPLITCGLIPETTFSAVPDPRPYDAAHTAVTGGPCEGSLVIRTGLEHPLDVVAMVERLVNAQARG